VGSVPNSYRDLIAWQRAMTLANQVYEASGPWPSQERFGLISQARRSAVSVPANIAEGQGRNNLGEFVQHLGIAHGSLCELEKLLLIGTDQGILDNEQLTALLGSTEEVGRLIQGRIKFLRARSSANSLRTGP
jgi:four helix bundle protein